MDKNKHNIPVSALYTAATWRWGELPCAEFVTPADAQGVFRIVNAFMVLYRWINPAKFSLRHQLLHRHTAIDHLLAEASYGRVIEIACGFSPRGSRVSADPGIHYVEMDLPDVIAGKRRQLSSTASGRAVLARPNFELRAADINTLDFSAEFLGMPTAVVTEGLMMYFPREAQLPIWRGIAKLLAKTDGVYLFDYIPLSEEPKRSRLGQWLHHFREAVLGIRSDFAYDGRSRSDVLADLRLVGFDDVTAIDTGDVARPWGLPAASVPTRTIIYRCRVSRSEPGREAVPA